MVSIVIALIVTLAVTSTVITNESTKRTTTSTNDMNQTGSYASYFLDRAVRSAGSGFTQASSLAGIFGCRLTAKMGSTPDLPRTNLAFPAPFATYFLGGATGSGNLRVAPVLIGKGQADGPLIGATSGAGSDVLVVMGGNAAAGDVPRPLLSNVSSTGTSNIVRVNNAVGITGGDLTLVSQTGETDCLLEPVTSTFVDTVGNTTIPLSGTYFTSTGSSTSLAAMASSGSAYLTPLGNTTARNVQFQLFGVGANRTLFAYDLLRADGNDAAQAIADGVAQMHALYGLDTNADGILDKWVDPGATGYDIATLMANPATIRQIVAIRVALVMRGNKYEKEVVSTTIPALFDNLTPAPDASLKRAAVTLSTSGDDQHYRYRLVEFTIPLRNVLLLPTS
ncbi:hypothetical protein AX767_11130 [Variovorax sp. PAMC 28711]|nr:hypothetical protein AX767_11130 [Variovorax sp. PAMC 28711]